MIKNKVKRLQLLTPQEQADYYERPNIHPDDHSIFFALNDAEYEAMQTFGSLQHKIFFILQLGYFRAKQQFFNFTLKEVKADVAYILQAHFGRSYPKKKMVENLAKNKTRQQIQGILTLCQYGMWSSARHTTMVLEHLSNLLKRHPKGQDTFRELLVFLEEKRITLPAYRTIQDLFTKAFANERKRIDQHMSTLDPDKQKQLQQLIDNDKGLSHLNLIRCDQTDFSYTALKTELKKLEHVAGLYPFTQTFTPLLGLSRNALRYYASMAEQYSASRLRKLSSKQQSFYVLCFIHHRYQEFLDNLITSFLYYLKKLNQDAKKSADDAEAAHYKKISMDFPELADFLRWYAKENPENMTTPAEFQQKGFTILEAEKQQILADFIAGQSFDKTAARWEYYQTQARHIAMYLRPILLSVPFESHRPDTTLMQLIKALRDYYSKNLSPNDLIQSIPETLITKIPKKMRDYLSNSAENGERGEKAEKTLNPTRLEIYIYDKMAGQIDYGRLFCNDSIAFASLEDDLVPDALVDDIEETAKACGYPKIATYCDQYLDDVLDTLDTAWATTNGNIANQQNKGIKITKNKDGTTHWTLSYDSDYEDSSEFFKGIAQRDIADVIKYMGDRLNIWQKLQHKIFRYTKQKSLDSSTFIASLLAEALGFSDEKMAETSNVGLNALRAMRQDYLYVENLSHLNAFLSDYIDQLPVSRVWDLYENKRVADGDGQKFVTRFHTLQSRFSAKYYRTRRGISIYTLMLNHIPVNAKAIGPHEHESHHLFDLLYNNPTNIPIDFVTGDNHAINQLNYIAANLIDVEFIPSIKQIRAEAEKLYSPGDPKDYEGFLKPCGQIDKALIRSERRGILRILLSLILQENTQAVIVRKLSSHKRYSRLRSALWEYNKIFKSMHILNMIDSADLRKTIKTARNRTESYHQLQRTLRKVSSGVFKGRRVIENQISCQATRLVSNFMIAYNVTLLDGVYKCLIKKHGIEIAQSILSKISPVAWPHLLFTGRYHFKGKLDEVDVEKVIVELEKNLQKKISR